MLRRLSTCIALLAGLMFGIALEVTRADGLDPLRRALSSKSSNLALRVSFRSALASSLDPSAQRELAVLLYENITRVGFDLTDLLRKDSSTSEIQRAMDSADELIRQKNYTEAWKTLEGAARLVKEGLKPLSANSVSYRELKLMEPHIFQAMGRVAFAQKRFKDALVVWNWISPRFAYFQDVLLGKAWAGFRLGRVDIALGAIASMKMDFFGGELKPEAALIQAYLYRRLCRDEELKTVRAGLRALQAGFLNNENSRWALLSPETRALARIAGEVPFSKEESEEQKRVVSILEKQFQESRSSATQDVSKALGYLSISAGVDRTGLITPEDKQLDRKSFLQRNLEIWPVDKNEQWADEIGAHRFIGKSKCNAVES